MLTVECLLLFFLRAFSDEQSCASVNDPPFPEVNKEVNYENADDSASEATEEISEDEGEDGHEDTSFVDETSNHDEDSLQSDLSSYSGDHSSCSDADDESSDDEEIEDDQEEAKVIVDWGEIAAEDLVSKVSSSVTEDNDSVSADEIEDFIGKPETSDMVSCKLSLIFLNNIFFTLFSYGCLHHYNSAFLILK